MRRLALALALVAAPLAAQPADPADLMRAMRDAVARADDATAEARAREALARYEALSPDQLVEVHTTLGILLHARDEAIEARRQFEAALSLRPDLELDPVLVSPKTIDFFDEIRAEVAPTAGEPVRSATIRYVAVPDPRPTAALRSLAVPGWGQIGKGDRTRGIAFATAWGVGLAGTLGSHLARADARRAYLAAGTPEEATALYADYDRWHKARAAFALGTGVVWAAAVVDALATGGPEAPGALSLTPGGVTVRLGL